MKKPVICRNCQGLGHYRYQCFKKDIKKPKVKVVRKRIYYGKVDKLWVAAKKKWFKANPSINGYYYCHYCSRVLVKDDELNDYGVEYVTLDHKVPKGNHIGIKLKYDISNLLPSCSRCNTLKGSRSYESFCREFYPHLLELEGE